MLGTTSTTTTANAMKRDSKFFYKDEKYSHLSGNTSSNRLSRNNLLYLQPSKWLELFLIVVCLLFIFGYISFFRFVNNTSNYKTQPSWKAKKNTNNDVFVERNQTILYRIIGNDLPPRHKEGQTLSNLQFILGHEPNFPNTQKIFLLNRTNNPENEANIISLLDSYNMVLPKLTVGDAAFVKSRLQPLAYLAQAAFTHSHNANTKINDDVKKRTEADRK